MGFFKFVSHPSVKNREVIFLIGVILYEPDSLKVDSTTPCCLYTASMSPHQMTIFSESFGKRKEKSTLVMVEEKGEEVQPRSVFLSSLGSVIFRRSPRDTVKRY